MVYIYENVPQLIETLQAHLLAQKQQGKKVIAYFAHEFIPPEIIRAVGAVPLPLIFAGDDDRANLGAEYLTPTMCPFALAQIGSFQQAFDGTGFDYLKQIDAIVSTNYCAADRLVNEWNVHKYGLRHIYIHIPFVREPSHIKYYKHELIDFAQEIGEFTGHPIDNSALTLAIQEDNQLKSALVKICGGNIKGSERVKLCQQATLFGPLHGSGVQDFNLADIEQYAVNLPKVEKDSNKSNSQGARMILAGGSVFIGDSLPELVEECGGNLIGDATWLGNACVPESIDPQTLTKDPMQVLADRFKNALGTLHCAPNSVDGYLSKLDVFKQTYDTSAFLYHIIKFCDITGHHRQEIKRRLTESGNQVLLLEKDYSASVTGQLRTRIEAFLEMIR